MLLTLPKCMGIPTKVTRGVSPRQGAYLIVALLRIGGTDGRGKIRVGVIGANVRYGWGMRAHLPALLSLPEYELTAVCTAHPDTAEESAKQYGARLAFHDYQQMVTHPEIDLVSVAVKVPMHYAMVMAALGAGKHVYCEWPLGANLGEAEEMAALANTKGVRHLVGLQARCDPALLRLQELLRENYLGKCLLAT